MFHKSGCRDLVPVVSMATCISISQKQMKILQSKPEVPPFNPVSLLFCMVYKQEEYECLNYLVRSRIYLEIFFL